jgi:hypothetical protein
VSARLWRLARQVRRRVARAARLAGRLAAELSDQNAYARHLASHGLPHSADEWRRFSDRRLRARFGQAKCC